MSAWTITTLAIVGLIIALAILDKAPDLIRAVADARIAGAAREASDRYSLEELAAALLVAIERTDADVGPELAERLAGTVIEDLNLGVIGPELRTPPT